MAYRLKANYHFRTGAETGINKVPVGRIIVVEDFGNTHEIKWFKKTTDGTLTDASTINDAYAAGNIVDTFESKRDIADSYSQTEVDSALSLKANAADSYIRQEIDAMLLNAVDGKADVATTLAGYGITDAYTIDQVNLLVSAQSNVIKDSTNTTYVVAEDTGVKITGDFIPTSQETFDLGSDAFRFKDLYLSAGTVYMGDSTFSTANGDFVFAPAPTTYHLSGFSTVPGQTLTLPITFDVPVGPFMDGFTYHDDYALTQPTLTFQTTTDAFGFTYVTSITGITNGGVYSNASGTNFKFTPTNINNEDLIIFNYTNGNALGTTFTPGHHTATFTGTSLETLVFDYDVDVDGVTITNLTITQTAPIPANDFAGNLQNLDYNFVIQSDDSVSFVDATTYIGIRVVVEAAARGGIQGVVGGVEPLLQVVLDETVPVRVLTELDLVTKQDAFVAAPTSSIGQSGDTAGMIAFDTGYVYYCVANYDGSSNIWSRVALTLETW